LEGTPFEIFVPAHAEAGGQVAVNVGGQVQQDSGHEQRADEADGFAYEGVPNAAPGGSICTDERLGANGLIPEILHQLVVLENGDVVLHVCPNVGTGFRFPAAYADDIVMGDCAAFVGLLKDIYQDICVKLFGVQPQNQPAAHINSGGADRPHYQKQEQQGRVTVKLARNLNAASWRLAERLEVQTKSKQTVIDKEGFPCMKMDKGLSVAARPSCLRSRKPSVTNTNRVIQKLRSPIHNSYKKYELKKALFGVHDNRDCLHVWMYVCTQCV
jgi:hypothetical protein